MREYAKATTVRRILKEIVHPAVVAEGFSGTRGCWSRSLDDGAVNVSVHLSSYGSGSGGGNTFDVEITLNNKEGFVVRQSYLTRCLVQNELDELLVIQSLVNARRPRSAEAQASMRWLGPVGEFVRARYQAPQEIRYREGSYVAFDYYAEDDVRAFCAFIASCVVSATTRFLAGDCPAPVTQPDGEPFTGVKTVP